VIVSDGRTNGTTSGIWSFAVAVPHPPPINHPPTITGTPPEKVKVGDELHYRVTASDEDKDPLHFMLASPPDGMTINYSTGDLGWTPRKDQVGNHTIHISVTDGKNGTANQTFMLAVYDEAIAIRPVCSIGWPTNGTALKRQATFWGTALKGSAGVKSVQVRFDGGIWMNATGTVNWSCDIDSTRLSNGKHAVQVRAYDGSLYSDMVSVDIKVDNPGKQTETGILIPAILLIIILAAVGGTVAFLMLRKKCGPQAARQPPNPPPDS
jgi:hypothetical protein